MKIGDDISPRLRLLEALDTGQDLWDSDPNTALKISQLAKGMATATLMRLMSKDCSSDRN